MFPTIPALRLIIFIKSLAIQEKQIARGNACNPAELMDPTQTAHKCYTLGRIPWKMNGIAAVLKQHINIKEGRQTKWSIECAIK